MYKNIIKANSLFGAIQVLNIIIQIVKTKLLAILIGASGFGIISLYNAYIDFTYNISHLGLHTTAIKFLSKNNINKKYFKLVKLIYLSLLIISFLFVFTTVILFSERISQTIFDSKEYSSSIIYISAVIIFRHLTSFLNSELQALRKLKQLAKANVLSNLTSFFIVIPLYYFYGIDIVVVAFITASLSSFIVTCIFSEKLEVVLPSKKKTKIISLSLLNLGLVLVFSTILNQSVLLILKILVQNNLGIKEVGIYSAGLLITNTYLGLIFSALATDYFPRLSSTIKDNTKSIKIVNAQTKVILLVVFPLVIFLIFFINFIVSILFTEEFIGLNTFVKISAIGLFFKSISWCLGYVIIANANKKKFILIETISQFIFLGLSFLLFFSFGINGIALATSIGFIIYFVIIYYVVRKEIKFRYNPELIRLISFLLLFIFISYIIEFSVFKFKIILKIFLTTIILLFCFRKIYKLYVSE